MVIGFNSEDRAVFVCKDPEYKKKKILDQLKAKIDKENPSSIIVLNHDSLSESEELVRYAKQIGIPVNFMIGGHSHHFSKDDSLKIYYPHRFCESMFDFDMDINRGKVAVTRNTIITSKGIKINRIIPEQLAVAKAEMDAPVVKSVLNLDKNNAAPSTFGTFLADAMRESTHSDIGFFSQGFNTEPLPYRQGEMIRERDLKEAMSAGREIVKVTLSPIELKEVFQHALKEKYKSGDNKRGLQFSQNIKIEGHEQNRLYTVDQIYINGESLFNGDGSVKLDEKGHAPEFSCAVDGYIAEGKSGYTILKEAPQEKTPTTMKEALLARLQLAESTPNFVENPYSYPKAQVITL